MKSRIEQITSHWNRNHVESISIWQSFGSVWFCFGQRCGFKTLGTGILDFLKRNILPKLKPLSGLDKGLVQGSTAHSGASSASTPRRAPGPPASARDRHNLTKPDPKPPFEGVFPEKQDKSINLRSCASGRLCDQPQDSTQLTWARRDPSWQLCPSSHCSRSVLLPLPGHALGRGTKWAAQPRCLCSEQGSSHGNWKFCVNSHQTHWGEVSSRRTYYVLIRVQLDISLASTH